MKVLIDACVLYPTVLREIVLGVAATGYFAPLWSERILEEWARAAARLSPGDERIARGEIAAANAAFPEAMAEARPETAERLWLPDANDIHVLAAAIDGGAEAVLTLNIRDFPLRILNAEGLHRRHPDEFLLEAFHAEPDAVRGVVGSVHATAERLSGEEIALRPLLKRAKLPRLGKALA